MDDPPFGDEAAQPAAQLAEAKNRLRAEIRRSRSERDPAERDRARAAIREHVLDQLTALALPPGAVVAAYQPLATEPGSPELLAGLVERGYRVLVPITLPDRDLDWHRWEDNTTPLGLDAIAEAAVILVPAFAVDHAGNRLGRGGGSYDRALARVGRPTVAALLFEGELVPQVPSAPWDRPVTVAVTPSGWVNLR